MWISSPAATPVASLVVGVSVFRFFKLLVFGRWITSGTAGNW